MKKLLLIAAILPMSVFAVDTKDRLSITPIIGLERVQKFQPTTSMKTRAIYGVTVVYKFPISALETEYTHAQDTSSDTVNNTEYKDSEDKLRVGLRGSFTMTNFMSSYLRGGAQYRKNKTTKTVNSTTTTEDTQSKVQPYVGTGVSLSLGRFLSVSANVLVTYTPTDDPNLKDYELQPSVGLNLKF